MQVLHFSHFSGSSSIFQVQEPDCLGEETVKQSCCSGADASVPFPRFHKGEKAVGGMREESLVILQPWL